MSEKPQDPKAYIMALAQTPGDGRLALLEPNCLLNAGRLCYRDSTFQALLESRLKHWTHFARWKAEIRTLVREHKKKKEKVDAEKAAQQRLIDAEERGVAFIAEGNPVKIAEDYIAQRRPNLVYYDSNFYDYRVPAYYKVQTLTIRSDVQQWYNGGVNSETGEPAIVNKTALDHVMDAIINITHRDITEFKPPVWFDHWEGVDPDPVLSISTMTGIIDVTNRLLIPATPRLFTMNGVEYGYSASAPEPVQWLEFLHRIWPDSDERQNIATLQEAIGYSLTPDTSLQKMFLFTGQSGAGKGTIANVISEVIGELNVTTSSANIFQSNFGMQSLLDKLVLIIPELITSKRDSHELAVLRERLLMITGEDAFTVDRKYKDPVQGRLTTRIFLLMNKDLIIPDQSGALTRRYVPFYFGQGKEEGERDPSLLAKFRTEYPGILNWAIDGLRRLRARKNPATGEMQGFVLSEASQRLLQDITRKGSPVRAFIRECCVTTDKSAETPTGVIWRAFEGWFEETLNKTSYITREMFPEAVRTAIGEKHEPRRVFKDGKRLRVFPSLKLREELEGYNWMRPDSMEADEDDG